MRNLLSLLTLIAMAAAPLDGAPRPWKPDPYDIQADEDYLLGLEHDRAEYHFRALQAISKRHNHDPWVRDRYLAAFKYDENREEEIETVKKRIADALAK